MQDPSAEPKLEVCFQKFRVQIRRRSLSPWGKVVDAAGIDE